MLGRHRGHHHFTVGQRRGIGVAASEPLYVLGTDADSNRVTVGTRAELATTTVSLTDAVLHRPSERVNRVKLRYHSKALNGGIEGTLTGPNRLLTIELSEPADRVAPGQTAVLLDGELVVGYGTIAG